MPVALAIVNLTKDFNSYLLRPLYGTRHEKLYQVSVLLCTKYDSRHLATIWSCLCYVGVIRLFILVAIFILVTIHFASQLSVKSKLSISSNYIAPDSRFTQRLRACLGLPLLSLQPRDLLGEWGVVCSVIYE